MLLVTMAAALAANSACSGFYGYLPSNREEETPFSVEVQPTALSILYLDYSRVFAERQKRDDGVIQVFDPAPGGVNYWLVCSDDEAFLTVDHDQYHPTARVYRLTRIQGDIWSEAKRRGSSTGD